MNFTKSKAFSADNTEGFYFQTAPVRCRNNHRSQWCAIKEGSDMVKTRMIRPDQ